MHLSYVLAFFSHPYLLNPQNDSAVTGQVFHYRYSSRDGDGAWFGLHKVDNYATYIAVSQ